MTRSAGFDLAPAADHTLAGRPRSGGRGVPARDGKYSRMAAAKLRVSRWTLSRALDTAPR
jgi:hypothetical protein